MAATTHSCKENAVTRLHELWKHMDERFKLMEKWTHIKQLAQEHPLAATMVTCTLSLVSLPVTCFVAFTVGSLLTTIMALLIIEGFMLTLGLVVLSFSLLVVGGLSVGLCTVILGTWVSVTVGAKILGFVKDKIPVKISLLQQSVSTDDSEYVMAEARKEPGKE